MPTAQQITFAARAVIRSRWAVSPRFSSVHAVSMKFGQLGETLGASGWTHPPYCPAVVNEYGLETLELLQRQRARDIKARGGRCRDYPTLQAHNVL